MTYLRCYVSVDPGSDAQFCAPSRSNGKPRLPCAPMSPSVRQTLSGRRQPLEGAVFGNKQTCLVRRLSEEWGGSCRTDGARARPEPRPPHGRRARPSLPSSPTTFPHGCEKESGAPPPVVHIHADSEQARTVLSDPRTDYLPLGV